MEPSAPAALHPQLLQHTSSSDKGSREMFSFLLERHQACLYLLPWEAAYKGGCTDAIILKAGLTESLCILKKKKEINLLNRLVLA